MRNSIMPAIDTFVINEVAPIVVYSLVFVLALGGAWAVALSTCGWGHVKLSQVDFFKATVRVECK